jgi:N-acetyl-alpha-D-glucosaminyl L-malate synthase BshA
MKIGMVCYPTFGGSGVVATELGMALAQRGHEVHFVSYEPPARYHCCAERVSYHEVAVSTYPLFRYPPYLLAMASKLAEVAENEALDLVHVHYAIPHTISACLARQITGRASMPIVTTLHGTDVTIVGREPEYRRIVEYALRLSDGITAVSRSLADETTAAFEFAKPIEVIPNFVAPELYRPADEDAVRHCVSSEGEAVLVHVSNMRPVKNVPDVVRIFARVAAAVPARLVLVGDGPELSEARRLAKELGVADRVKYLGETPDVARVLSCADVFLLPSSQESFGLSALEAMACGVPVVASRVGGIPEVVVDDSTGLLYEVGDVEGMAAGALAILADAPRRVRMRSAARDRVAATFTTDRVVPLYERHYERVLAAGGGGASENWKRPIP